MPTTPASNRDERNDLTDEPVGKVEPESEPIVLTARDWEAFLAEWDDADRPRPQLEALVRRFRNRRLAHLSPARP